MDPIVIGVLISLAVIVLVVLGINFADGLRGRPERPKLTMSRSENQRRDAEYRQQLADWKAARGR